MKMLRVLRESKNLDQYQLADALRQKFGGKWSQADISRYERGLIAAPDKKIKQMAEFFEVRPSILRGEEIEHNEAYKKSIMNTIPPLQPQIVDVIENARFGPDTVPLLGQAKTSFGTITMGKEIGRVLRHPNQQGRRDGYAVEVWDNTMSPRYMIGEPAYPLSEKHPEEGKDCYIFFKDGEVVLRRLILKTDKEISFEQLNPPKKFRRQLSEVEKIHAIVGRG